MASNGPLGNGSQRLTWRNDTTQRVHVDQVVALSAGVGVAETRIEPGAAGALVVRGTRNMPAADADVLAQGDVALWDPALFGVAASGSVDIGRVIVAKPAGQRFVHVDINANANAGGGGGTVTPTTQTITDLTAVNATPGADGTFLVVNDPANPPRRYFERINGQWVEQGGSAAAPLAHGPDVATWGALPATGAFIGETRQVALLDDPSHNHTGAGAAVWRGLPTGWTPEGGTVASGGGPTRHAVIEIRQTVTDAVFDITAPAAHYTISGDLDGTLGADAAAFAGDESVDILNEVGGSVKPDIVWLSPTTFRYPGRLDPNDRLQLRLP